MNSLSNLTQGVAHDASAPSFGRPRATAPSWRRPWCRALLGATTLALGLATPPSAAAFVSESKFELIGTGDFDGNGKTDVAIVERKTGKYRLGFQQGNGTFIWASVRKSELANLNGLTLGQLLQAKKGALVVSSAERNQITVVDISSPTVVGKPSPVQPPTLGPTTMAAVEIGGDGNTPLEDLVLGSTLNDPDPMFLSLVRNTGAALDSIADVTLKGEPTHANRVTLASGAAEVVGVVEKGASSSAFRAYNVGTGKAAPAASADDLPAGADYAFADFAGSGRSQFVFFALGASDLVVRPVEEAGGGLQFGAANRFSLGKPIQAVYAVPQGKGAQLLVIFNDGARGAVYQFDGVNAPKESLPLPAPSNEYLSGALALESGFMLLSGPIGKGWSSRYHLYRTQGGTFAAAGSADLPTLDETDVAIHARIVASLKVTTAAQMEPYTNTIPGTAVRYAMLPIPGGEFVMGTPEGAPGRNADEGPQHKVQIAPFWMGRCEVTWNEFELFMYPDEERKFRANNPTDEDADKVADVVARPTKPYTEMSFGMGKDGYPAIAMTQHAANKYCQWLSAKTGHFYRLPTEAEWEYACRAGTTTAYSFGDDPSALKEYAWYEDNSDFKYHKVGTKKPNPWGLHDMHGNVLEWCLDQYDPELYQSAGALTVDPWNKATKSYPHSARGGSYDDEKTRLRSGARRGSDRTWKMQDPQLPKSVWYFSDAPFVGLRLVRPLKVPPPEELSKYWTSGVERD